MKLFYEDSYVTNFSRQLFSQNRLGSKYASGNSPLLNLFNCFKELWMLKRDDIVKMKVYYWGHKLFSITSQITVKLKHKIIFWPKNHHCIESAYNGSESIAYLGPKIWNMVPSELKEMSSISSFKKAMVLYPSNCP